MRTSCSRRRFLTIAAAGAAGASLFDLPRLLAEHVPGPQQRYAWFPMGIQRYSRRGDGSGFHFLTGDEKSIRAAADAVGFKYRFVPETGEFAHAASIYVTTPLGQLSRYFFGVEFSSRDLRLALVEAAEGKIGGMVDQLMLFCYRYDPAAGKYSAEALAVVRLAGLITVLSLAGFIGLSQWRERRASIRS